MCGIVALFSMDAPVSEAALQAGMDRLQHRGPDGRGSWLSPGRRVALGHTRLSIIDPQGGAQPIGNRDGSLQIVVNGEFYGFERIQQDLRKRGYRLKTSSDSEIALHLYDEFGTHCLHQLRGEFAFALWDQRNELLFAARDRFGIKPLYYHHDGRTLRLASEVKALFAAGVPAAWDRETFWHLESGLMPQDRTLFDGVRQVPPGHFLVAGRSGVRLRRYWDFDYPPAEETPAGDDPAPFVEQLRDALDDAVRVRLRADVPVGCYLSGGLDSSAVLSVASRFHSSPVQAFTLAFDHEDYNEESLAREAAARAGASLHVTQIRQSDVADHFSDSIWHCETISLNGGTTSKYLLSRAVRDAGYKVVLTGEGADEIFAGYAHFRQDLLLHGQPDLPPEKVAALLEELKRSNRVSQGLLLKQDGALDSLSAVRRLVGFAPSWMEAYAAAYQQVRPLHSPEFTAEFEGRDVYRVFFNPIDAQGQLAGRDPVHQSLYLWSKSALPNYLLRTLGDGMEMAHSIEGRLPFLDHPLVECVRSMPMSLKIRGLTEKYVLREAVKPWIADSVYRNPKHPFLAPPSTFQTSEPLQELIQDSLRSPKMASMPFYNQPAVVGLLDMLPRMPESKRQLMDPLLMKMLSAFCLQDRFGLN